MAVSKQLETVGTRLTAPSSVYDAATGELYKCQKETKSESKTERFSGPSGGP